MSNRTNYTWAKEIWSRLVSIFIFTSLFFFFFLSFIILEGVVGIYDQGLASSLFYFRSPTILWGKARLDYVGFCVPLSISFALIYLWMRLSTKKVHWMAWVILTFILVSDLLYSLLVHELRLISANGGGINLVALPAVFGFILYMIYVGSEKEGVYLSFILGFVIGAISDLESFTHTSVATTYGGRGIFDADFIVPVSLSFAFLIMLKMKTIALSQEPERQLVN